jgi:hypothetical protein
MCKPQWGSGIFGEESNLSELLEFEPRIFQPVAESLYRMSYSGSNTITATYVIKSEIET